jgi:hypothetical protein
VVTLPYELASDAVRSGGHFYPVISELEDIKRRKCDLGKYGDYIEADCPAEALHASGAFVNGVPDRPLPGEPIRQENGKVGAFGAFLTAWGKTDDLRQFQSLDSW